MVEVMDQPGQVEQTVGQSAGQESLGTGRRRVLKAGAVGLAGLLLAACKGINQGQSTEVIPGDSGISPAEKPFPFEWKNVVGGDTFGEIVKNPAYKDNNDILPYANQGVIVRRASGETFAVLGEQALLASMANNWFGVSKIEQGDTYVTVSADRIRSFFEGNTKFGLSGIVEGTRKDDGSCWVTKVEFDDQSQGEVEIYRLGTNNLPKDGWRPENWQLQPGQ